MKRFAILVWDYSDRTYSFAGYVNASNGPHARLKAYKQRRFRELIGDTSLEMMRLQAFPAWSGAANHYTRQIGMVNRGTKN